MAYDNTKIIGKFVKDIYGSYMGKVVGMLTDIDGSVQSVGVDCGSNGLRMIPDEHLVTQGDVVIFIPKWRLESQRLIREQQLTLRRLRAMIEIAEGGDDVHADAEIIQQKYCAKLDSLQDVASRLKAALDARLDELEDQMRTAKMLLFDAKVQHKSNEIQDATFDTVRLSTGDMIEHMSHEAEEINSIKERIRGLETEVREVNDLMSPAAADAATAAADAPMPAQPAAEHLEEPQICVTTDTEPAAALPKAPAGSSPGPAVGEVADVAPAADIPLAPTPHTTPPPTPKSPPQPETVPGGTPPEDLTQAAAPLDSAPPSEPVAATPDVPPPPPPPQPVAASPASHTAVTMDAAATVVPTTASALAETEESWSVQPPPMAPVRDATHSLGPMGVSSTPPPPPPPPPPLRNPGSNLPPPPAYAHGLSQHDAEVTFPEPPRNLDASKTSPKKDDDWLSRMASQ